MLKRPALQLRADSKPLDALIMSRVLTVSVTDNKPTEADKLTITLDDHDGALELPRRGVRISVGMGFLDAEHGGIVDMGDYIVDACTWSGTPDTISVEAHAADFKGSLKASRSTSYHKKTFGEIASEVAQRQALTLSMADKFQRIDCQHIDQTSESDMHLLTRLCYRYGATFTIKKGKLLIYERGTGTTPSGQALDKITITRQSGDQFSYKVEDKQSEYTEVTASYHDQQTATRQTVKSSTGTQAKAAKQLKGTYKNKTDATAAAAAEKHRITAAQAKFSITTDGILRAGSESPVTLQGFKSEVDAHSWTVDKATHSYSKSAGITTQLELIASA